MYFVLAGLVVVVGIIIFLVAKDGKKATIADRITSAEQSGHIIEGEEEETYGVYPAEDLQFAIYTSTIEIDKQLEATLYVLTQMDEGGEQIRRSWIECTPETVEGYEVSTEIIASALEEDTLCVVGNVKLTDKRGDYFSRNVLYAGDSVFKQQ